MKYSKEDKEEWNDLYEYVKKDIMQYDLTQSLPKNIVLKLKEYRHGTVMANQNQDMIHAYTYKEVLMTFKFCKPIILKSFDSKQFDNEFSKFLYANAIVKNNINDMKNILESRDRELTRIENLEIENNITGITYKKKEKRISQRLKNML